MDNNPQPKTNTQSDNLTPSINPKADSDDTSLVSPQNETDEKQPEATKPEVLAKDSLKNQLEKARRAMEGPERTLKRERYEIENKVETEKERLENELAIINKDKERYEINWVVLDNKQTEFKKILTPIKEEEERIELEEDKLEGLEHTTSDIKERQEIEKKRWAIQDKRKEIEKEKWLLEDKILNIDSELKKNTTEYQKLLDREYAIKQKIDNLEYELEIVEEQIKLRKEAENKETKEAVIKQEELRRKQAEREAEEKARKEAEKKLAQEKEAEVETLKPETRATIPTLKENSKEIVENKNTQTKDEELKNLEAEQKERADMEIRRQQAMGKLKTEENKTNAKPEETKNTPEKTQTPDREAILNSARQKALASEAKNETENSNQETGGVVEEKQKLIDDLLDTTTPKKEESKNDLYTESITLNENTNSNQDKNPEPVATQENQNINTSPEEKSPISTENLELEGMNIPKMRTFKTDIENTTVVTDDQKAEARKKFPWLK